MKKKVVDIEVVDYVASRGQRKGEAGKYVVLTLENRGGNWIAGINRRPDTLPITQPQRIVDIWIDFAKQLKESKKPIEEVVPDEFRQDAFENVYRVNVPLDQKAVRLYRKDEKDKTTGKILHRKGDVVVDEETGKPFIYDSISVLVVEYEDDSTGEKRRLQEPSAIVRDLFNRGYYAYLDAQTAVENAAADEPDAAEAGAAEKPEEDGEDEPTLEELQAKLAALKAKGASA